MLGRRVLEEYGQFVPSARRVMATGRIQAGNRPAPAPARPGVARRLPGGQCAYDGQRPQLADPALVVLNDQADAFAPIVTGPIPAPWPLPD